MRLIVLIGLIVFLSGLRPARSDDAAPISPRALDLEFASAVDGFVDSCQHSPNPFKALIDQLDSDHYKSREKAAKALLDANADRWLIRARIAERRPEVRYWLNRILRAVYRCERCGGLGYCPTFEPVASEAPAYSGVPCRRCGRSEWQHGEQWIGDGVYGRPACDDCRGLGTYWNHYAVD